MVLMPTHSLCFLSVSTVVGLSCQLGLNLDCMSCLFWWLDWTEHSVVKQRFRQSHPWC